MKKYPNVPIQFLYLAEMADMLGITYGNPNTFKKACMIVALQQRNAVEIICNFKINLN